MITNIEIGKLWPHHDNPRKDLGDLTELAESIKANGILQNLTVVPWFSSITGVGADDPKKQEEMGYTVVIGHRRLAAAKLAGMTEIPCIITSMDLRTQIATMLLENMQRSDLTIWEQAQGFQMMLNFGETVGDISQKTGFSESTVRRRVKLLELDDAKFKAATERGATLQDYMELDKIESIDRKNAVLDKIGTSNFQYELRAAIDAERKEKSIAAWESLLSAFATRVETTKGYKQVKYLYFSNTPEIERPADADEVEYFYCVEKWGQIYLMIKDDGENAVREDSAEARRRERLNSRIKQLDEIAERVYKLRWDFVKGVSVTVIKKNLATIVAASVWERMSSGYTNFDDEELFELLGADRLDSEDDDYTQESEHAVVTAAIAAAPERAMLYSAYLDFEDSDRMSYHNRYRGKFEENETLDSLYALLEKLGYKMSDEEKSLQDNTHELFSDEEDGGEHEE